MIDLCNWTREADTTSGAEHPVGRHVKRAERAAFALIAATLSISIAFLEMTNAAEIKMLTANGVKGAVSELGRQFEVTTGHVLIIEYEVVDVLKRRIDDGQAFDVTILRPEVLDELIRQGKVLTETRTGLGRTGLGLAVRKGAPRPDIATSDALRRTLLNAKSVGYAKEGGSGTYVLAALDRLGIAAEMKPKLKAFEGSTTVRSVVTGEVDMVLSGLGPILGEPGAELVGSLPDELQTYIVFTIGMGAAARNRDASKALIQFLTSPAALPMLKTKGLEPGTF